MKFQNVTKENDINYVLMTADNDRAYLIRESTELSPFLSACKKNSSDTLRCSETSVDFVMLHI